MKTMTKLILIPALIIMTSTAFAAPANRSSATQATVVKSNYGGERLVVYIQGGSNSEAEKLYNAMKAPEVLANYHHPEKQVLLKELNNGSSCEKPSSESIELGEKLFYSCYIVIDSQYN